MAGHGSRAGENGSAPPPLGGAPATGAGPLSFDRPAPEGAASCRRKGSKTTMSQVLGEITWLMSQSAIQKRMFIEDL